VDPSEVRLLKAAQGDVNRRDALRTLAAGTLGAVASTTWVESLSAQAQAHAHTAAPVAAAQAWTPRVLTARQNTTVVMLTELIIPETDTPGAKATGVNRFIDGVLHEAQAADREEFVRGLAWIDERSTALFGRAFADIDVAQQTTLLTRLADDNNKAEADRPGVEFFRAIKSMTITGYYTTEIGLRRELGDDGRLMLAEFEGCTHPEHQG
jgi:hypothetical protein